MKYFIGLDAHSSTSTFAVMDQEGQCVLRKTVDTSEKNLWNVIEGIQGERILTFEESTISQWLYISLREILLSCDSGTGRRISVLFL